MDKVWSQFINPVILGALLCVGIGLADIWHFHGLGVFANTLLSLGLGGLLGFTVPVAQAKVQATMNKSTTPTP